MIVVDLPMPQNCMYCVFRMKCRLYLEWLYNPSEGTGKLKNFPKSVHCLIKDEIEDGS